MANPFSQLYGSSSNGSKRSQARTPAKRPKKKQKASVGAPLASPPAPQMPTVQPSWPGVPPGAESPPNTSTTSTPLPYQYNTAPGLAPTVNPPLPTPQSTSAVQNYRISTPSVTNPVPNVASAQRAEDNGEGEEQEQEVGEKEEGEDEGGQDLMVDPENASEDLYDSKSIDVRLYARTFTRFGGVFVAIADMVVTGVAWENKREAWVERNPHRPDVSDDEDDDEDDNEDDRDDPEDEDDDPNPRNLSKCEYKDKKRREIEGWKILCDLIPKFRETMKDFADRGFAVKRFGICVALQREINICRGNDTSGLKSKALHYVDKNLEALKPELSLMDQETKVSRGWSHPQLAEALLPLKYAPTEENIALAGAHSRAVETHHHIFPRWLYACTQQYNAKDENEGLFFGHYLVYVLRHIYTGPRSVAQGPKSRKRSRKGCIAQRIGMTELTPRAVAYACCQAQFAISNQETWDQTYYDFDLAAFYWNIVDLLSTGRQGKAAMKFLNQEVFGDVVNLAVHGVEMTGAQRLLAQRV